jgi:hypothetical protein
MSMPERYALEDVSFSVQDAQADIPCIAVRWLDVTQGQTVGVAPHAPHAVTIGPRVTRWLNEIAVNVDHAVESGRIRVRKPTLEYLGATAGDTLTVKRDGDQLIVRLAEGGGS